MTKSFLIAFSYVLLLAACTHQSGDSPKSSSSNATVTTSPPATETTSTQQVNPQPVDHSTDPIPKTPEYPLKLSSGKLHTYAIVGGQVFGWGNNQFQQLWGTPTWVNDAVDIATGTFNTCVLRATGQALCWAGPDSKVQPLHSYKSISMDRDTFCGIGTDAKAYCLVLRGPDELTRTTGKEFEIKGVTNPKLIMANSEGYCVSSDEGVNCRYLYGDGQFFHGEQFQVLPKDDYASLVGSAYEGCALLKDGTGAKCFEIDTSSKQVSTFFISLPKATEIAGDFGSYCASTDRGLVCWNIGGTNYYSKYLGNIRLETYVPDFHFKNPVRKGEWLARPITLNHPSAISVGDGHFCASENNQIFCAFGPIPGWSGTDPSIIQVPDVQTKFGPLAMPFSEWPRAFFPLLTHEGLEWSQAIGHFPICSEWISGFDESKCKINWSTDGKTGEIDSSSMAQRACAAIGGRLPTFQEARNLPMAQRKNLLAADYYKYALPATSVSQHYATSSVWKEKGKIVNGLYFMTDVFQKQIELQGSGSMIRCVRERK